MSVKWELIFLNSLLKLLLSRTKFNFESFVSSPGCGIHILELGYIFLGVRNQSLYTLFLLRKHHLSISRIGGNVGLCSTRDYFQCSLNTKPGSKLQYLIPVVAPFVMCTSCVQLISRSKKYDSHSHENKLALCL